MAPGRLRGRGRQLHGRRGRRDGAGRPAPRRRRRSRLGADREDRLGRADQGLRHDRLPRPQRRGGPRPAGDGRAGDASTATRRSASGWSRRAGFEPFAAGDELPAGISAHAIGKPRRQETPLLIPSHRALVFGDAVVGTEDGPRIWAQEKIDERILKFNRERFGPVARAAPRARLRPAADDPRPVAAPGRQGRAARGDRLAALVPPARLSGAEPINLGGRLLILFAVVGVEALRGDLLQLAVPELDLEEQVVAETVDGVDGHQREAAVVDGRPDRAPRRRARR